MSPSLESISEHQWLKHSVSRRKLLSRFGLGLGGMALNEMLAKDAAPQDRGVLDGTH